MSGDRCQEDQDEEDKKKMETSKLIAYLSITQ